jgi:hypothetical protein
MKEKKRKIDAEFGDMISQLAQEYVKKHKSALATDAANNPADTQRSLKTRAMKQVNAAFDKVFQDEEVESRAVFVPAGDSTIYSSFSSALATTILSTKRTTVENGCIVLQANEQHHPRHYFASEEKKSLPAAHSGVSAPLGYLSLIAEGHSPSATDLMTCSHLCHNNRCFNYSHLQWETKQDNDKRERCHKANVCSCNQSPKCFPTNQ